MWRGEKSLALTHSPHSRSTSASVHGRRLLKSRCTKPTLRRARVPAVRIMFDLSVRVRKSASLSAANFFCHFLIFGLMTKLIVSMASIRRFASFRLLASSTAPPSTTAAFVAHTTRSHEVTLPASRFEIVSTIHFETAKSRSRFIVR